MSCHAGPDIVENGLVFCYDMNNTQKSWKGKPTTNYLSAPTVEVTKGEFGQYYDLVSIFETYGLVPYSLSFDMKANKPGNVLWYMQNGSYTKYQFVYHSRYATTEWQRFKIENITPTGPDAAWQANTPYDHRAMLATYTGYGSGVNPIVKNIQLELGSFSTPFIDGTRSNVQAILDLTNNNTITATNLTYNSDGTFSFDGSYNYIQSPNNCSITGSVTLSAWIKPSRIGQTGPHSTILCTDTNYPYGVKLMNFKNSTRCVLWLGFGGTTSYEASISNDINDNSIKMLTGTWDMSTGNVNMYINGELQNTINTGYTIPVVLYDGKITLGTDYHNIGSGTLNKYLGNIYSAFIYNRALSSDEVKQNFNATRRIYGI